MARRNRDHGATRPRNLPTPQPSSASSFLIGFPRCARINARSVSWGYTEDVGMDLRICVGSDAAYEVVYDYRDIGSGRIGRRRTFPYALFWRAGCYVGVCIVQYLATVIGIDGIEKFIVFTQINFLSTLVTPHH